MTFSELLPELNREYGGIADLVSGLSDEQLARKAHIPMFKEAPMGEYLTLGVFVGVLGEHHLGSHIDHMREILQGLGGASALKKENNGLSPITFVHPHPFPPPEGEGEGGGDFHIRNAPKGHECLRRPSEEHNEYRQSG